ncbi:hypothetical protein O3P69_011365 [Scylla paramamosain]|uniref:Uncharacterized protein n=1 Tax=Scylla paramamosain TaxID=85552 RepID=A0AAW0T5T4_SCYPA
MVPRPWLHEQALLVQWRRDHQWSERTPNVPKRISADVKSILVSRGCAHSLSTRRPRSAVSEQYEVMRMYETFHQLSSSTDEKNESRSFIVLLVAIGSEYVWVFVNRGGLRISTRAPTLTPSHTRRSADCHYSHVLTHEALCCQSK